MTFGHGRKAIDPTSVPSSWTVTSPKEGRKRASRKLQRANMANKKQQLKEESDSAYVLFIYLHL